MANLNKVMLIGRLTRDPEDQDVLQWRQGREVRLCRQQSQEELADRANGKTSRSSSTVEAFNRGETGKQADLVEQGLRKGSQVFIEGHLKLDNGRARTARNGRRSRSSSTTSSSWNRSGRWRRGRALSSAPPAAQSTDRRASAMRRAGRARSHPLDPPPPGAERRRDSVLTIARFETSRFDHDVTTATRNDAIRSSRARTAACSFC